MTEFNSYGRYTILTEFLHLKEFIYFKSTLVLVLLLKRNSNFFGDSDKACVIVTPKSI